MTDLLPISALQHLLFCERQCALIHVEREWSENRFTAEGRVMHERAHAGPDESRPGVRISRGMEVASARLGLFGQCDVVEFYQEGRVIPVEYKRGKPKSHRADEVQLCAQALCLEEMLGRPVPLGALFYGEPRRRSEVPFDEALRALTVDTATRLHTLIDSRQTPPAYREKKCDHCSLLPLCMPAIFSRPAVGEGAAAWFIRQLEITES